MRKTLGVFLSIFIVVATGCSSSPQTKKQKTHNNFQTNQQKKRVIVKGHREVKHILQNSLSQRGMRVVVPNNRHWRSETLPAEIMVRGGIKKTRGMRFNSSRVRVQKGKVEVLLQVINLQNNEMMRSGIGAATYHSPFSSSEDAMRKAIKKALRKVF